MTQQIERKPRWWRRILENALVPALVSIVMSGLVSAAFLVFFESRLENSKEKVATVARQNDQFNNAQSKVFAQLSIYTGKLFDAGEVENKDKENLQTAIIDSQLQVARLRNELRKSGQKPLIEYSEQLDKLSTSLRKVKAKNDLKPILESAQRILELHDEVAEEIRNNSEVSIF